MLRDSMFGAVAIVICLWHGLPIPQHGGDLVHDFYPAGRSVLRGYLHYRQPPYTPAEADTFRYPPFAALAFAPVAALPLHAATVVWWVLTIICLVATAAVMSRLVRRRVSSACVFLGLVAFGPIQHGIHDKIEPLLLLGLAVVVAPTGHWPRLGRLRARCADGDQGLPGSDAVGHRFGANAPGGGAC